MKAIGKCKLCLNEGVELEESHLMPAGSYRRLLSKDKNPHPILITEKGSRSSSNQVIDNVLCRNCEALLDRNGENYAMRMAASRKGFPLLDELARSCRDQNKEWRKSTVVDSPGVKRAYLVYFALSVFWRAAVHRWPSADGSARTPRLGLGSSNTETLRKFLLGEVAIPRNMNLFFVVLTDRLSQAVIYLPSQTSKKNFRWGYGFQACGYMFNLLVGKHSDPGASRLCLIHSPEQFIWIRDGEVKTREAFQHIIRNQAARRFPK